MTDLKRTVQGDGGVAKEPGQHGSERDGSSRTAGTNRDFDESGTTENQGHGHPREQRQGSSEE